MVIADGDTALDLDTVAALSRSASALLDGLDDVPDDYVLEVSSPGVDRPLTSEKAIPPRARPQSRTTADGRIAAHRPCRRDARRHGSAGGPRRPRVGPKMGIAPDPLAEIVKAVVQVEFSPPTQAELELATGEIRDQARGTEAGA
jgi:ribosome maturation factor RimP